jgi:hypothetical protein
VTSAVRRRAPARRPARAGSPDDRRLGHHRELGVRRSPRESAPGRGLEPLVAARTDATAEHDRHGRVVELALLMATARLLDPDRPCGLSKVTETW